MHQAKIIRQLLIELGVAFAHQPKQDWSIFYSFEPPDPDNCITVFNTRGTLDGRIHETGETQQHLGFQIKIRGKIDEVAQQKGTDIIGELEQIVRRLITVDGIEYRIQAITIKSPLMHLGQETKKQRQMYVVNAIATIDEV